MVQNNYSYQLPRGIAGGLYDMTPHSINSRSNGEDETGTLKFGMGVVVGNTPGADVLVPTNVSVIGEFEGVAMNGGSKELDMDGELNLRPKQIIDVLQWGRIWVRTADGVDASYGEDLYLVIDGDEAGLFTNDSGDGIAVPGRFIGGNGTGNVAPVEIYNQKAE